MLTSLRVAIYHDLPSGGAKRALHQQVNGLVKQGHEVEVYVPATADEQFLPLAEVASRVRVFPRPPQPNREEALAGTPSPALALRWLRYLALVRRSEREIASIIDGGGHDIVLVAASQFTQAPWILRWLRTPSVYYCQEPLRAAYEPHIASTPVRFGIRHTLGRVDRRNLRAATAVAANSRFSAANIQRIYERRALVNYLAVDTGRFRPLLVPRGDYVLTVAAMHPLKGLDFLIEALGRVPLDHRPPLRVVSDRSRENERQRVEALACGANVRLDFRLRVDEEELVRLYNGARLIAYAPHNEPFGFVPLEAMACGRPVLGVREGGIPETVVEGETGFLADRNLDAFAARIGYLLGHPAEAEAVAARAAEIVRTRWSWERSVQELADICTDTAARARRSQSTLGERPA